MAKVSVKKKLQYWGTGRRKSAVARVRLIPGGNGTITIGLTLVVYGAILIVHDLTKIEILKTIDLIVLICGFLIGLIIIFYALKKYNKGIF